MRDTWQQVASCRHTHYTTRIGVTSISKLANEAWCDTYEALLVPYASLHYSESIKAYFIAIYDAPHHLNHLMGELIC